MHHDWGATAPLCIYSRPSRRSSNFFAAYETLRGMWVYLYHILTIFLFLMYSNPKMPKIRKFHAILRTAAHPGTGFVSLAIFELYKCSALSHTVVLLLFVWLYEAVKIK